MNHSRRPSALAWLGLAVALGGCSKAPTPGTAEGAAPVPVAPAAAAHDDPRPAGAPVVPAALGPGEAPAAAQDAAECAVAPSDPAVSADGSSKLDVERFARDDQRSALDRELEFIDPTLDGFDTEVLNSSGGKVLSTLAQGLTGTIPPEVLEQHVAPEFECGSLRLGEPRRRYAADGLEIEVGQRGEAVFRGREGLADAMRELGRSFVQHSDEGAGDEHGEAQHDLHTKFKIAKVEVLSDTVATTGLIYLATGSGASGPVQQDGHWLVRWDTTEGYGSPRLLGIEVEDFAETTVPRSLFSDCTESAFADPAVFERVLHGIQSWWGRIDTGMGFSLYGDYALALGDVDGDGLDDVYVCQPGSLPNLLLRHLPDGTLQDISAGSGTDYLDDTPSAVFADFDNDGRQDLLLASLLTLDVLAGDGTGKFRLAGVHPTDNAVSLSVADYDADGLLDVYVCRYSSTNRGTGAGDTIYDSDQGKPNVLLHNEGSFQFRDATEESGISHNNNRFSFSGVWEDYDDDGDLDLYVANDFGRNNLYRNEGGRFRDVAGEVGAEDMAAGMGVTWGDYDLDGNVDLYVSNMFSSAGGRIVDKARIEELAGADAVAPLARFAKGNTLLRNRGDGTFDDVSFQAGVTMGRWSWGGEFVDVNNDAWLDLMVPNGFVTNVDPSDL